MRNSIPFFALLLIFQSVVLCDVQRGEACQAESTQAESTQTDSQKESTDQDAEKALAASKRTVSAAELFPSSAVAYAEIKNPSQIVETILNHPLRKKVEEIEPIKNALGGKDFAQFLLVRGLVEIQIGMGWKEAIAELSKGGMYGCIDPETDGIALISYTSDEEKLKKALRGIVKLVRQEGEDKAKVQRYRGLVAVEIDRVIIGILGNKMLVTNEGDLAKKIADAYLDGQNESLATNARFSNAKKKSDSENSPTGWAYLDVEKIRDMGLAKELFQGQAENIAAEFILGGILSNLKKTPYATMSLTFNDDQLGVNLSTPHDPTWVLDSREYFFGKDGKGRAPAAIEMDGTVLNISTHRNLSKLWLAKEDLMDEDELAGLAQADSQLRTFFSGNDFGQDILGAGESGIQLIATEQNYSKTGIPQPDIKIPSFAFVFELKDRKKVERRFKVGFQSLVGFLNIALGQQGMPQFETDSERNDGTLLVYANYFVEDGDEKGLINYNFSPTIGFVDNALIISSTTQLGRDLLKVKQINDKSDSNTFARLSGPMLLKLLNQNRDQLVAQNMLSEGSTKEESEVVIDTIFNLLESAKDLTLDFKAEDELNLELNLNLKSN